MLELITFEDNLGRQVILDDEGNLEITKTLDKEESKIPVNTEKIDSILDRIRTALKSKHSRKFTNYNVSSKDIL